MLILLMLADFLFSLESSKILSPREGYVYFITLLMASYSIFRENEQRLC